jgi:hypothetical protein
MLYVYKVFMYASVACGTIFGKGSSGPVLFHTFFPLRNNSHGQQNNFPILRQPDSHSVLEYCDMYAWGVDVTW